MIGGISKVRPCGHHHYYKYAHAVSGTHPTLSDGKSRDMYQVSREYWKDVDADNCWNFSLENATRLSGYCFELGRFTKFKAKTPKLIHANEMFTGDVGRTSPKLTEIEMDYSNLTGCTSLFYGMNLSEIPNGFNPKTRYFLHLFTRTGKNIADNNGGVFPYNEVLNSGNNIRYMFTRCNMLISDEYTFENATNVDGLHYSDGYWFSLKRIPSQLSFKNVKTMNYTFFINDASTFTTFQTVDEMGELNSANHAFYGCSNLTTLYPDYPNYKWPKLSSATGMFYECKLNKKSILWLYNALPTWTSGTHNITIGCHIDHKYDPEVNLALKKLNMDYVTPIEEAGGTLTEEVTSDKGWTTIIEWNGTATSNAYPAPTTTSEE